MFTILQFGPVYTHWGLCGLRPFSTLYLRKQAWIGLNALQKFSMYSNFRNYAPPLDEKGGIITEKVVPVFSEG